MVSAEHELVAKLVSTAPGWLKAATNKASQLQVALTEGIEYAAV